MIPPVRQPGDPAMTRVLAIVGEHRHDPDHLLALGEDGQYYDLHLPECSPIPIEPGEEWLIEPPPEATTELLD